MFIRTLRALPLSLLAALAYCPSGGPAGTGVVVESVAPRSAGDAAGIRPGDVIVSWSCAACPSSRSRPARGGVDSPYDLLAPEIEESPRHAVTLRGKRGEETRTWTLRPGPWGIVARPELPADLAALYRHGKARVEAGDIATAERSWRSAAQTARIAGDGRLAAWFLSRLAEALAEAGRWPEADAAYGEAGADLEQEPDPRAAAQILRDWGGTFDRRTAWDAAAERYEKALALDRKTAAKSLAAARTLSSLGSATARQERYGAAEKLQREALAIREELAPGTLEVAASLNKLGTLARLRGDLDAAQVYLTRGEALQRRLAPGTVDHASFFMGFGSVAFERGELKVAERWHLQALAIIKKSDPGHDLIADGFLSLANIAFQRGDLAATDRLLRIVLVRRERRSADDLVAWRVRSSLGQIAWYRRERAAAEEHLRLARTLAGRLAPEGPELIPGLRNLGELALLHFDLKTANTSFQRVKEIAEKSAPGSADVAQSLADLARVEVLSRGGGTKAEGLLRQALAILEKAAPGSVQAATLLRDLGEVVARSGRPHEALALHRSALEIQSRLAPGSDGEAEALHFLGRTERQAGMVQEGIRDQCRAVDVVDRQTVRLNGALQKRSSFGVSLRDYYSACLEGRIELGQPAEAFHVLERSRARSFVALLEQRDITLSGLPPEIAAERRRVSAKRDNVLSRLAVLNAGRDGDKIERLTAELSGLRTRQEEIAARIRRESPRSAALEDPEPLDLAGVRASLEPGTVLLEYMMGAERTWLFVVQPGSGLTIHRIDFGDQGLRSTVEGFHRLMKMKKPLAGEAHLHAEARYLYDLLVRPAEDQIAGARRILISADGPLRTLAFAALQRGDQYLVQWKPLHSVLSATVHAELATTRPSPGAEPRIALACHGTLAERFPLDSALALTLPGRKAGGQDNSPGQAWEIFESVRLNDDLVTLSPCDMANGQEMDGESLAGLTRAFQYAGAPSVLAMLWGVEDGSTAPFLERFYGHLRGGKSKDEALRAAQIEAIREKTALSHPFHWAAFQLNGDWQ
jgi:CHAT domain-containing protein/tetratricopeptide (TPR) repeat protein